LASALFGQSSIRASILATEINPIIGMKAKKWGRKNSIPHLFAPMFLPKLISYVKDWRKSAKLL